MAKIEMLVNLENFNNMKIETNDYADVGECYKEVLSVLEDWEDYSKYAISLGNNIRKVLGIDEKKIVEEAKAIINKLQNEDKKHSKFDKEDNYESKEGAVCFDNLENVTIMAESESGKAYHIIKDGYQTWLAKSHIIQEELPLDLGILIDEIPLREDRKWILNKKKDGKPNLDWEPCGG